MTSSVQAEFKALQDNQRLLGILIFSLVTIAIWVIISIITSKPKEAISAESQALAAPLNPDIDVTVLDEIDLKRSYDVSELSSFPIYVVNTPSVQNSVFGQGQTPVVVPTQSATNGLSTLNATSSGTASGSASPTTPAP